MLRITTLSVERPLIMLTKIPVAPAVAVMPPSIPSPLRVRDFVIVMEPKPPGSRTLISPPVAVFVWAPAKVLQGAVRLQGLTSSPVPETQVRGAWAWATVEKPTARAAADKNRITL